MSATVWTQKTGYEQVHGNWQKDTGEWINTKRVPIHRLCAVAWFGLGAVKDRHVHHRVNIPWLNVESNLESMPQPEHSILTGDSIRNGVRQSVLDDVVAGLGGGSV